MRRCEKELAARPGEASGLEATGRKVFWQASASILIVVFHFLQSSLLGRDPEARTRILSGMHIKAGERKLVHPVDPRQTAIAQFNVESLCGQGEGVS
jgi:hypothetical protein